MLNFCAVDQYKLCIFVKWKENDRFPCFYKQNLQKHLAFVLSPSEQILNKMTFDLNKVTAPLAVCLGLSWWKVKPPHHSQVFYSL